MSVHGSPSKYNKTKSAVESPRRKTDMIEDEYDTKIQEDDFCSNNFEDFTSCTSLHGLQYMSVSKTNRIERSWWFFMIILSVGACGTMIFKVWIKWYESPVIVSFAESSTPVWQIPFPAVTICSETRVRQSVFNYTNAFYKKKQSKNSLTEQEIFEMEAASLVCDNLMKDGSKFVNRTTIDFLKNVSQPFKEMFASCEWKKETMDCKKLFRPIFTENGQCHTFNILDAEELFRKKVIYNDLHSFENGTKSNGWTMDTGYPKNLSAETYPERGTTSGAQGALTLILHTFNKDVDYLCDQSSVRGFKISFHAPSDFPRVSQQYFMVPLQQDLIVAIKPNMIITSKGLVGYDPHRRKCFLTVERKLMFFRVYTQQNCELECLSNYTMSVCGCVAFWMPGSRNIPVCSSGKKACMIKAQDDLQKLELRYALAIRNKDKERLKIMENSLKCDCLPACTSLNYDSEVSQSEFNWKELAKALKNHSPQIEKFGLSRVRMFFKDSEFIMSRRSELYGITDFLANCGGIMGLFLGFSFLSLVEIIYFLAIKPICNFRKKRNTQAVN